MYLYMVMYLRAINKLTEIVRKHELDRELFIYTSDMLHPSLSWFT